MADFNTLYEQLKASAESAAKSANTLVLMMTEDANTDVNIDGYGPKPSFSKQLQHLADQISDLFATGLYGYILLESFQAGNNLTLRNHALHWAKPDGNGEYYRWDGALPKSVPAGSTPASTGGVAMGAWVSVGDAALRTDLLSTDVAKGDALLTVQQTITGWPERTQHDKNADYKNARDAGALGVGGDDTAALQRYIDYLESLPTVTAYPYTPSDMDLPPGNYGIKRPLRFTQPIRIRGKGVVITALTGFAPLTVDLQTGGTEAFNGMLLFVNGKKGADSGQGQLRFGVEIDSGITLDCHDIAYPNIYIERFPYSKINCVLHSSVHDGMDVGPSMWGLKTQGLNIENFADAAIRLRERSAVNGANLDVKIWGNFKTGNVGIQFDSESACNGVVITGFIEKVNYGIIASRSTGPVSVAGVDFEQCQYNVIRAASDMSDGRKVGPISFINCFLHAIEASKIYAEGAVVTADNCRMYTGGTGDFETDAAKTGLILFDNCMFEAGAIGVVAGANVRGRYTHTAGDSVYNYATNSLETFASAYEIKNFEWKGYPLTQTSGFTFSARASVSDDRNYGRVLLWTSDRTSTSVQTVSGVTLATDNAVRYFGPMLDNQISFGSASARPSVVYAVSGTINTSDVREKQQQRVLYDAEKKAAAEIKSSIRAYKRNDEVEQKGEAAKWHFGVMAQGVAEILKRNGLDHEHYHFLSYEEWDAMPEIIDEETGKLLATAKPAGNRWGVEYSQLLCFIISTM